MSKPLPTIAFFGATGGCALHCLVLALQAGYHCNALTSYSPRKIVVRTPTKLTDLLITHDIPSTTITTNLHIIPGNATDTTAVRFTLLTPDTNAPVSLIITGIGSRLKFESLLHPTLENPTICQDAMSTLLEALHSLPNPQGTQKPRLVVISGTGVDAKRDVPYLMLPLFNWMLRVPHADKRVMEGMVLAETDSQSPAIENFMIVRPSLLVDGVGSGGLEKVRVGTAEEPAIGYVISRGEVGRWVFENAVAGLEVKGEGKRYWGQFVTLTN
ncbi:uncharacterized protein BO97DRAFT_477675 [Aspergillus homomorphus CBS 101889]|uniref:NAD(P)-binding domain-containing protein n=1 Tax=Aspergillus homomorphus (strain CBS 101889) TaxID=1450537 RepID=A0A395HYM7_ASPHC|nr:hypothetical protein BO97DRAFT_477675 [Aspergillus homomorphus CBS 101889]RAL12636.1 hypothetical protein BO97DRAFT_477675 [Aspergillus homomorphus CBS 101889]